jgi:hypothetical protein
MNGYANSNCFKQIQKRVNRFVGVPVTWLVFLSWRSFCWLTLKTKQGWVWLRQVRGRRAEA